MEENVREPVLPVVPAIDGHVHVIEGVESPQLGNRRDLFVYLPSGYGQDGERYPVIYMHDGQNLFDAALCFSEEWGVDEAMEALGVQGIRAIVVGIPNAGAERVDEYSPFVAPGYGRGHGDAYLAFIVQTIKPRIDRDFLTLPDRASTGIFGSSLGGLISLYGLFRYPEVFGFAGAMSPSVWFADMAIVPFIEQAPYAPGRIYLDVGTSEGRDHIADVLALPDFPRPNRDQVREVARLLVRKGYSPRRDVLYVEATGGEHSEAAWSGRFPTAMRFLLQGEVLTSTRVSDELLLSEEMQPGGGEHD